MSAGNLLGGESMLIGLAHLTTEAKTDFTPCLTLDYSCFFCESVKTNKGFFSLDKQISLDLEEAKGGLKEKIHLLKKKEGPEEKKIRSM